MRLTTTRRVPSTKAGSAAATADVAVVGAGGSGLAVLKALRDEGIGCECFERGSAIGGNWRYENDSGLSAAYASLRTNVSRQRMQFRSLPMPESYGDFPHHTEMAEYLDAFADRYGLRQRIRFGNPVERLEPCDGGWLVQLEDGSARPFRAAVVAVGHDWSPQLPSYPGSFAGEQIHSQRYRRPQPYAGKRVLVVGAGQSAVEIALDLAPLAARASISVRRGANVVPRWIGGDPYDVYDVRGLDRVPWRLLNLASHRVVTREQGPPPASWPLPGRRLLEGNPTVSSALFAALRRGDLEVKPAIEWLEGKRARFVDGSQEGFDAIVYATGYRIELPFLAGVLAPSGRELPLYRRIVHPDASNLFFAGFADAPTSLLRLVEEQGEWIAAVLAGRLALPDEEAMWRAIERGERRSRQRYPEEGRHTIRCDPHAYRRLLRRDLRGRQGPAWGRGLLRRRAAAGRRSR
jgi:dimethylaniline monooxygenase (N-oxide forming)